MFLILIEALSFLLYCNLVSFHFDIYTNFLLAYIVYCTWICPTSGWWNQLPVKESCKCLLLVSVHSWKDWGMCSIRCLWPGTPHSYDGIIRFTPSLGFFGLLDNEIIVENIVFVTLLYFILDWGIVKLWYCYFEVDVIGSCWSLLILHAYIVSRCIKKQNVSFSVLSFSTGLLRRYIVLVPEKSL